MPSRIPFGSIFDFSTFCWKQEFVLCASDGLVWYVGFSCLDISVADSLNWFTFSSRLGPAACRRGPLRTPPERVRLSCRPSLCPELKDSNGRTYLHSTACWLSLPLLHFCFFVVVWVFFFVCLFFCFQLGWGRPLCVYWGEGLKRIIPNFLMYCFFSPPCFN